jgi:hypothetical protein
MGVDHNRNQEWVGCVGCVLALRGPGQETNRRAMLLALRLPPGPAGIWQVVNVVFRPNFRGILAIRLEIAGGDSGEMKPRPDRFGLN